MTTNDPERTPEEQAIIDEVAESRGRDFAERHAGLILAQARLMGELRGKRPPDDGEDAGE